MQSTKATQQSHPSKYVFLGVPITIHLSGEQTGGQFTLIEGTMPAGGDGGLHAHRREDETMYLLDGELDVDDRRGVFHPSSGRIVFCSARRAAPAPKPWLCPRAFTRHSYAGRFRCVRKRSRNSAGRVHLGQSGVRRTVAPCRGIGRIVWHRTAEASPARVNAKSGVNALQKTARSGSGNLKNTIDERIYRENP